MMSFDRAERNRSSRVETTRERAEQHALQCMEIWGGSHATSASVSTPGLDLWVFSQPHEDAASGGDVHYASLCGGGVITRFILADVSGHGSAVADLARSLRTLMRRNINRKSQARLVQALNREFARLAEMQRFATALVATYLTKGDRLTICNAGHPRPLWYRAAAREWSVLAQESDGDTPANLPLGIDDATPFDQMQVTLGKGDLLLFYTDALTEATDPADRALGEAGLLELMNATDVTDPTRVATTLVESLARFRGGLPAEDDLTFLLLHHNAGHPRPLSLLETLKVYAKVLRLKRV